MNVLLITAYFPPNTGSAAHLFYELGAALVNRGHQVTVLTIFPSYHAQGDISKYRGKGYMEEDVDGVRVIRVKVPQFPRHVPAGRALWQFSLAFKFALAALKLPSFDASIVYSLELISRAGHPTLSSTMRSVLFVGKGRFLWKLARGCTIR